MRLKKLKFRIINLLFKQLKVAGIILFCFAFITGNSQTVEYLGSGNYEFDTKFPTSDLHFYLFDDGYHSFDKNSVHQYGLASIPASPVLFSAVPYDDDDPDEFIFPGVDTGVFSFGPPVYQLENQIEVKRSWNMVDGKENYFLLMFENSNSDQRISGCIEFHYNNIDIDINVNEILDDYNNNWVRYISNDPSEYNGYTNKFKWEFEFLNPGEQRFVYIPAKCLKGVFSNIDTRGVMKIDKCEEFIPENSKTDGSNEGIFDSKIYTLESIVSNFPHDPNCIVIDPTCLSIRQGKQTINYKVYFQNEGKDPVQNVSIDIESHGELIVENIRLVNASNDCELIWNLNTIEVLFENIFLLGMGQDPNPSSIDETIGWVELELCFYLDEDDTGQEDNCYSTNGVITFDKQPPLPISNSFCREKDCRNGDDDTDAVCLINSFSQRFDSYNGVKTANNPVEVFNDIYITPNVSSSNIKIEGLSSIDLYEISIFNTFGRFFKNIKIRNSNVVDISDLPKGIYFLKVKGIINYKTLSFVKI